MKENEVIQENKDGSKIIKEYHEIGVNKHGDPVYNTNLFLRNKKNKPSDPLDLDGDGDVDKDDKKLAKKTYKDIGKKIRKR